ncbi:MAG: hypothetical protein ACRC6V_14730 [Bacteroidales bacterium]
MNSVSVSLEQLKCDERFVDLIKETMDDRLIYSEALESLESSQLFALYEGEVHLGFYSLDFSTDSVEAHAYIYPEYRRYSVEALRYIIASQSKTITTSVYGTHPHVLKFLTRAGFVVTDTLSNALVKHNNSYPVWVLKLYKE